MIHKLHLAHLSGILENGRLDRSEVRMIHKLHLAHLAAAKAIIRYFKWRQGPIRLARAKRSCGTYMGIAPSTRRLRVTRVIGVARNHLVIRHTVLNAINRELVLIRDYFVSRTVDSKITVGAVQVSYGQHFLSHFLPCRYQLLLHALLMCSALRIGLQRRLYEARRLCMDPVTLPCECS
jgi:hypothetical protein